MPKLRTGMIGGEDGTERGPARHYPGSVPTSQSTETECALLCGLAYLINPAEYLPARKPTADHHRWSSARTTPLPS